jgi:hypothetical protein
MRLQRKLGTVVHGILHHRNLKGQKDYVQQGLRKTLGKNSGKSGTNQVHKNHSLGCSRTIALCKVETVLLGWCLSVGSEDRAK